MYTEYAAKFLGGGGGVRKIQPIRASQDVTRLLTLTISFISCSLLSCLIIHRDLLEPNEQDVRRRWAASTRSAGPHLSAVLVIRGERSDRHAVHRARGVHGVVSIGPPPAVRVDANLIRSSVSSSPLMRLG